jgi:hypothetical protein
MSAMRRVVPYLVDLGVLCLGGLAFFFLSRRLSSVNSSGSSESIDNALADLKAWKRTVSGELESQFERIRTIAGRMDRANRKEKNAPEAQGEAFSGAIDTNDQGKLNAILAERFHGAR